MFIMRRKMKNKELKENFIKKSNELGYDLKFIDNYSILGNEEFFKLLNALDLSFCSVNNILCIYFKNGLCIPSKIYNEYTGERIFLLNRHFFELELLSTISVESFINKEKEYLSFKLKNVEIPAETKEKIIDRIIECLCNSKKTLLGKEIKVLKESNNNHLLIGYINDITKNHITINEEKIKFKEIGYLGLIN